MAQNYTRQSSFDDGDTITASLFNNEFNQIVNALAYSASSDSSTGHKHDGNSGQGGNIPQIGDIDFLNKIVVDGTNNRWGFFVQVGGVSVEQIRIQDGAVVPVTDSDIDLGTSSLEFKDLFLDGTAHIDTLDVDANATVAGTLGVTGNTTIGGTLGVTGVLTGTSLDISGNVDIDGVTNLDVVDIDGAVDMASTLTVTGVLTGTSLDISGNVDVDGVTNLDVVDIDGAVNMATTLIVTGNVDFDGDLDVDGTTNLDVVDIDGAVDMASTLTVAGVLTGSSLDISGDIDVDGTTNLDVVDIDGAVNMATTLAVEGNVDFNGDLDVDGTIEFDAISGTGAVTVTNILDEDDMSSDSATALATQQSIKAYVDAQQDTVDTFGEVLALGNTTAGTDISVSTDDKVQFRDSAIYINSSVDGQLDIVADTEIQIAATTIDIDGAINASGEIIAASLDISGDIDVDGTTNLDVVDIDGAVDMASTLTVASNIVVGGTVDGRDVATDGTKLDGIEASATADQSNAEIRTAVEAATDSNVFTDADHTKLNAIEASATADQTDAEIRAAVEAATDSNVFTDADHTKLNAIEASADVTDATNVTAAGALMDSELTAIASVKALNQGVATGDSPQFVGITSTANVIVGGNLTVNGTTTTLNTATLDVEDKNITLNYSDGDSTGSANGAGLTIQDAVDASTDATILWDTTNDEFDFSHPINVTGKVTSTGTSVFASLDISGDIDVDGTTNLDAVDIDGAVNMATTALVTGVLTTTATQVATGGITSGSNIVSDTDSTDDLGTTSVRWANLFVDSITATDQITATGFTGTLDGILGSGAAAAATITTLDTSGAVNLNLITDSSSSTSGALIVDGGVGIAKKLYVGTDLDVDGTTNLDVVDIDGAVQADGTVTVGVDDTGYDVKFFGATTGKSLLWDESADSLIVTGTTTMTGNSTVSGTLGVTGVLTGTSLDISGDIDVDGTTNLDVVDIDGAVDMADTLQVDGIATFTGQITANGGMELIDDKKLTFGNSDDLQIYHDGDNSYIHEGGTGNIFIRGANVVITTGAGTKYLEGGSNVLTLFHTGNEKMRTSSTGVFVTGAMTAGTLVASSGSITDTSGAISFGNENLSTTGSISGSIAATSINSGTISDARLPATISSNITGSSASCTGNAATATALTAGNKTIGGNLTVGNTTSSNIYMQDTDHGYRTIHCNSNRVGFLTAAGAWASYSTDAGLWECEQGVKSTAVNNTFGYITMTDGIRVEGTGITYPGATAAGGSANRIAFRWVSPHIKATISNSTVITVGTASDYRIKDVITNDIGDALSMLESLPTYNFYSKGEEAKTVYSGVLAHELEAIIPSLVTGEKDNPKQLQSVDYAGLTPFLIQALKQVTARLRAVEALLEIEPAELVIEDFVKVESPDFDWPEEEPDVGIPVK